MQDTPVTIVGAGPAGSLLGILLARRGLPITVFERRADMRREAMSAGRSINLALADRGIHALEHAGVLEAVRPLMIPMRGRMIHDEAGGTTLAALRPERQRGDPFRFAWRAQQAPAE